MEKKIGNVCYLNFPDCVCFQFGNQLGLIFEDGFKEESKQCDYKKKSGQPNVQIIKHTINGTMTYKGYINPNSGKPNGQGIMFKEKGDCIFGVFHEGEQKGIYDNIEDIVEYRSPNRINYNVFEENKNEYTSALFDIQKYFKEKDSKYYNEHIKNNPGMYAYIDKNNQITDILIFNKQKKLIYSFNTYYKYSYLYDEEGKIAIYNKYNLLKYEILKKKFDRQAQEFMKTCLRDKKFIEDQVEKVQKGLEQQAQNCQKYENQENEEKHNNIISNFLKNGSNTSFEDYILNHGIDRFAKQLAILYNENTKSKYFASDSAFVRFFSKEQRRIKTIREIMKKYIGEKDGKITEEQILDFLSSKNCNNYNVKKKNINNKKVKFEKNDINLEKHKSTLKKHKSNLKKHKSKFKEFCKNIDQVGWGICSPI